MFSQDVEDRCGVVGRPDGFAVVWVGGAGEVLFLALVNFWEVLVTWCLDAKRGEVTNWDSVCEHGVCKCVFRKLHLY